MYLSFQLLSMMDLRSAPGDVLDRVAKNGEAFIVERNGVQMACLVPLSLLMPDIESNRLAKELETLIAQSEPYKLRINESKELELQFPAEGASKDIALTIRLPHRYPSASPKVFAEPLADGCPHCWADGSLCIFGVMELWNPGRHDALHALCLALKWLSRYEAWRSDGKWPE